MDYERVYVVKILLTNYLQYIHEKNDVTSTRNSIFSYRGAIRENMRNDWRTRVTWREFPCSVLCQQMMEKWSAFVQ